MFPCILVFLLPFNHFSLYISSLPKCCSTFITILLLYRFLACDMKHRTMTTDSAARTSSSPTETSASGLPSTLIVSNEPSSGVNVARRLHIGGDEGPHPLSKEIIRAHSVEKADLDPASSPIQFKTSKQSPRDFPSDQLQAEDNVQRSDRATSLSDQTLPGSSPGFLQQKLPFVKLKSAARRNISRLAPINEGSTDGAGASDEIHPADRGLTMGEASKTSSWSNRAADTGTHRSGLSSISSSGQRRRKPLLGRIGRLHIAIRLIPIILIVIAVPIIFAVRKPQAPTHTVRSLSKADNVQDKPINFIPRGLFPCSERQSNYGQDVQVYTDGEDITWIRTVLSTNLPSIELDPHIRSTTHSPQARVLSTSLAPPIRSYPLPLMYTLGSVRRRDLYKGSSLQFDESDFSQALGHCMDKTCRRNLEPCLRDKVFLSQRDALICLICTKTPPDRTRLEKFCRNYVDTTNKVNWLIVGAFFLTLFALGTLALRRTLSRDHSLGRPCNRIISDPRTWTWARLDPRKGGHFRIAKCLSTSKRQVREGPPESEAKRPHRYKMVQLDGTGVFSTHKPWHSLPRQWWKTNLRTDKPFNASESTPSRSVLGTSTRRLSQLFNPREPQQFSKISVAEKGLKSCLKTTLRTGRTNFRYTDRNFTAPIHTPGREDSPTLGANDPFTHAMPLQPLAASQRKVLRRRDPNSIDEILSASSRTESTAPTTAGEQPVIQDLLAAKIGLQHGPPSQCSYSSRYAEIIDGAPNTASGRTSENSDLRSVDDCGSSRRGSTQMKRFSGLMNGRRNPAGGVETESTNLDENERAGPPRLPQIPRIMRRSGLGAETGAETGIGTGRERADDERGVVRRVSAGSEKSERRWL